MRPAQLLYVRWQLHTQNWRSSSLPLQDMTHCAPCVFFSSRSSYPLTPAYSLQRYDYQSLSLDLSSLASLLKYLWNLVVLLYLGWLLHLMCLRDHSIYSVTPVSPRLTPLPNSEPLPSSRLLTWLIMASMDVLKQCHSGYESWPGRLYLPCRYGEQDVFVSLV